ncbi:hypothetical protein Taro_030881, partial [Colocasia esculenta]|nr:hypothetical protein [Colocasia esculenta]
MTHPKRPLCATTATTPNVGASQSAEPFSPSSRHSPRSPSAMKKAKSQQAPASGCPLEKNGLQHQQLQHHPLDDDDGLAVPPTADEDAMLLDQDDLKAAASDAIPSAAGTTGTAANLSRKKAVPLQPASKKQLVIKLVKGKPKLPTNFEEDTWATLKSAITAIFLKQPDSCDLEKLYQAVSDLCLHKMGGNLYQRIQRECE